MQGPLLVGIAGVAAALTPQEEIDYQGHAFLFEADLEAGRRAGWVPADADDGEVLEAVEAVLRARLRNMGRFVEAQAVHEGGRRFSVTFVGRMADSYERFLIDGFTNPGRIAVGILAEEGELGAEGVDLAAERARLARWREEHPEAELEEFRALAPDAGGPHPALAWRPCRGSVEGGEAGEPIPLLAAEVRPLRRSDMERAAVAVPDEGGDTYSLSLDLDAEVRAEIDAFAERWESRRLAWVLNDEVVAVATVEVPLREPLLVPGSFSIDEVRAWILAVAGEPLPAPLRFAGFGKRPLQNVERRTEEDRRQ